MKKGTLITIIVIVIVLLGVIAAITKSANNLKMTPGTNQPYTSATTETSAMVTYTDNGFSPSTITIKNGQSVTWKNNSSGAMRVASNPHPSHTDLPGFDEISLAGPGQSWTYTFAVTGTHGYHNHANPNAGGTIIVQ